MTQTITLVSSALCHRQALPNPHRLNKDYKCLLVNYCITLPSGNNDSLVKLVIEYRHMQPHFKEPQAKIAWCMQSYAIQIERFSWPRLQQCIAGVNPSHVVRRETSSTLGPEDSDVSGSVEKGTNNARVRDYIHTLGKATHCRCQNLRSIPCLAH